MFSVLVFGSNVSARQLCGGLLAIVALIAHARLAVAESAAAVAVGKETHNG
jgi:hypothetical protein